MGCAIYFHWGNMVIHAAEKGTDMLGEIATMLRKSMILESIYIKKYLCLFIIRWEMVRRGVAKLSQAQLKNFLLCTIRNIAII